MSFTELNIDDHAIGALPHVDFISPPCIVSTGQDACASPLESNDDGIVLRSIGEYMPSYPILDPPKALCQVPTFEPILPAGWTRWTLICARGHLCQCEESGAFRRVWDYEIDVFPFEEGVERGEGIDCHVSVSGGWVASCCREEAGTLLGVGACIA